ncbi:MAG: ribonuclease III [Gammaproteobacteria bacterium]
MNAFQTRLGYRFRDAALLRRALTHRSYGGENNERLEFLGDSVLGLLMSEALFERFPDASEGGLSRMRAQLVCNPALIAQARQLAMQDCMRFGGSVAKSGRPEQEGPLADAFEAVLGALYLDGGMQAAREVVRVLFAPQLASVSPRDAKDHKTRLQELLQKKGLPPPQYEVTARSGAQHAPAFTVSCAVDGLPAPLTADGGSRRAAEQRAAELALAQLEHA